MIEGVGLRCQNCNDGGGSYWLYNIDFENSWEKKSFRDLSPAKCSDFPGSRWVRKTYTSNMGSAEIV